jgi:DNA replication protein DnaC
MLTIKESAAVLKLPFIRNNYEDSLKEAHVKDMTHEEFLRSVLNSEVELRSSNGIRNRIKNAHFPNRILLEDYRRDHLSTEVNTMIRELETLEFIENRQNVILIGNPGTGKTALATALGMKACIEGKNVIFISIPTLLIELKEAMNQNQILKYRSRFEKYDLCILDEFGYCSFDKERGEILFNLLSSRNEKGAMIITSNLTFDRWNEIFNDTVLTGAIIDRLSFESYLIDMSGESYRTLATRKWQESRFGKSETI